jgi:DNA-binding transcriptional ArsR family regulator
MPSDANERDRYADEEARAVTRPNYQSGYTERNFPDSHGVALAPENEAWVDTQDRDVDAVVAVERIRDENPGAYRCLMRSTADGVTVRVLRALVAVGGVTTYDDLVSYIGDVTRRTVRSKVADLRDGGVVDVGDGRPAAISFVDDDVALLAEDTLARLE